jgi:hypothetical protein
MRFSRLFLQLQRDGSLAGAASIEFQTEAIPGQVEPCVMPPLFFFTVI